MSRVPDLVVEELTKEQRRAYEVVAATRGGTARGPFTVWVRHPEVAQAASQLSNALRNNVDARLVELAILVVVRHWSAPYPWVAHESHALDAGLQRQLVESLRIGQIPTFDRDDERIVYDLARELLETGTVEAPTYDRAIDTLGLDLLIDIVTVVGFYSTASMVSNAFDVAVPGDRRPFDRGPG